VVRGSNEPGDPDPRDLEILRVLRERDGVLTEVLLKDGHVRAVWDIGWGYDAGESWAHISTNVSPGASGRPFDFFFTHEVYLVRDPMSGELLVEPAT
jgi:hypothetical protein